MGEKQLMLPGKIVKKSNALARARWSADSVWEPRIVATLAAQIMPGDTDFKTYEIRLVEILGKEPGGKDYKELKEAVYKAMSRVIVINNGNGWSMYNLFSKCTLNTQKGILEICFHPDLREHYLQLKQYMQYNILEFMLLPSIYSQRIFEFLKSWDDKKETIIELKELHEMLGSPKSFRASYKDFRRFALEKAHKDILKFTDLDYSWEPIKQGRAVHAIRFIFSKNHKKIIPENKQTNNFLLAALADNNPQNNTANKNFEALFALFPLDKKDRVPAGRHWHIMNGKGIAPLAKDVPENNELHILDFLEQWQKEHRE